MDWVMVTGGTRGLGLAICKELIAEGYQVVAIGRALSPELQAELDHSAGRLKFERFDLSQTDAIHDLVTGLCQRYSAAPYGLVNNAALGLDGVLGTQHEREIQQLVAVNVLAPILLTKYAVRQMMTRRRGRVINISSIIASTGFSGLSVYAATKAALVGFTKSLAREVGKAGITVNAIAPGFMATEMTSSLQGEKLDSVVRRTPLGRLVTVKDVAAAAAYLMGEKGGAVTGSVVTIDAGSTA
ncbi:SDR family NAD(P)-dependent oxidoreductase [Geomesophilobacter sediminis]|uniref:SDR family oxidoreductase n=1 Tax=Geomesophilobacter sediminis TaxID=2798584 RepID=A0A8J7M2N5_9BACT|nr:SDR family NAD(P)-dependent oxidoreductase [Geomesophilobacter sediminis]MBJ6727565.1 SDR family oxidoreductase [Geomesophilobacter sediminis]